MPDELAPLRDFADRFFHDALRNPENLREFLMDAVPTLAPGLDFSRVNYIEPTFLLPNWLRREADLLFEIPYRFGGAERKALVCILIEHQTRPDPRLPLRMLLEVALYWERQLREWEKAALPKGEFRLTPVLPIVLHSGGRPWGSARTISDMLGPPAAFFPFAPAWGPVFWELSQHSPEELLNAESAFLQVLTVVRMEDEERAEFGRFFQEVLGKVDSIHGTNRVRWVQMIHLSTDGSSTADRATSVNSGSTSVLLYRKMNFAKRRYEPWHNWLEKRSSTKARSTERGLGFWRRAENGSANQRRRLCWI
jgi:hypothetical protein